MSDSPTPHWLERIVEDANYELACCFICGKTLRLKVGNTIKLPYHYFDENQRCPGSRMREYETERIWEIVSLRIKTMEES